MTTLLVSGGSSVLRNFLFIDQSPAFSMPMTISLTTCYTPRPFKANDKQTPVARHEVHCNKYHLRSEMHVVSKMA